MNLKLQLHRLSVPDLEFGGTAYYSDPQRGLTEAGPFDLRFGSAHRKQVRLAIVGPQEMIDLSLAWFDRCRSKIAARSSGPAKPVETPYIGFEEIFRSELVSGKEQSLLINEALIDKALAKTPYQAFCEVVQLYSSAILEAKRNFRPDVVVCALPENVTSRCWSVQRPVSNKERETAQLIERINTASQFELPLDWELDESPEDLLNRDFRRALKAEAMLHEVPIQIVRKSALLDMSSNEDAATRAWNMAVGLYYKAGGIPWRIRADGPETCFVGVTFHHLRTTHRTLVYSALAQAFSSSGEGFALRGSTLEPDDDKRRITSLTKEHANELGQRVLQEYVNRNGRAPKRIVLHKSSRFTDAEQVGFGDALRDIPVVQLVALSPSSLRLVTHAPYPPSRGTLLTIEDERHFLFTSGYLRELSTYPGPHVPAPVELILYGQDSALATRQVATEVLALGRLNWNTSELRSSQPVTLGFARRVGGIMAEYGLLSEHDPDSNYRYYM